MKNITTQLLYVSKAAALMSERLRNVICDTII